MSRMLCVKKEKEKKRGLHSLLTAALASSHPIIINACLMVNKLQSSLTFYFLAVSFIFVPFLHPVYGLKLREEEVRV